MRFTFWKRVDKQSSAGVNVIAAEQSPRVIAAHFELGRLGEELAIEHLVRTGYRIVAANFSVPIGRNTRDAPVSAEIDIVAYDGPTLCFVEVKTRASDEFAAPQANVDLRKRRQIARAARAYRRMMALTGEAYRYDVVTVVLPSRDKQIIADPRIELLKNFWTDGKLRKRKWQDSRWD